MIPGLKDPVQSARAFPGAKSAKLTDSFTGLGTHTHNPIKGGTACFAIYFDSVAMTQSNILLLFFGHVRWPPKLGYFAGLFP